MLIRDNPSHVPQELRQEAATLRQSLSELSQWIQQKIRTIEEEMDVCKVIYSLHGSLSQVYRCSHT